MEVDFNYREWQKTWKYRLQLQGVAENMEVDFNYREWQKT